MNYVFSTKQPKRYRFPTHTNYLAMDRSEASSSEVFIVELAPGEAPPAHKHDDMEQVFYILSGRGRLEAEWQPLDEVEGPENSEFSPSRREQGHRRIVYKEWNNYVSDIENDDDNIASNYADAV